ncbi:hypothetical protein DL767_006359 [Monosporascus sp. MG133]|nr:hypothetical protein DL767_006359 [Monosporascus sp. MG133]
MLVDVHGSQMAPVDLLILGAGWTSTFLIPLLQKEGVTYAATTTNGRNGTIPFIFDPDSRDQEPYSRLPRATTVLITFPLKGKGQSNLLTSLYNTTHSRRHSNSNSDSGGPETHFIQLGVTNIWTNAGWNSEDSPYDTTDSRAVAEDELMREAQGAVLSLSGLYGGSRQPRHWVQSGRVAGSKADLRARRALHMVHGADVARGIVAAHRSFSAARRWIVCDMHVYDWWELVQDCAGEMARGVAAAVGNGDSDGGEAGCGISGADVERGEELLRWVGELMDEEGVRALPRDTSSLGRMLDGRAFWKTMGVWPMQGRVK